MWGIAVVDRSDRTTTVSHFPGGDQPGRAGAPPRHYLDMRLCPSVEGSASPLITHRIGAEVCMARQRTFFHTCHRCIYRGQAATWEPEVSPLAMINVHAAEEPSHADVKTVDIGRNGAVSSSKRPAKKARSDKTIDATS